MTEVEQGIVDLSNLVVKLRDENKELRALVMEARDLIKSDMVGLEWKRACSAFVKRASEAKLS